MSYLMTNPQLDINILFYSNKSLLCMNLIKTLKNENFLQFFCLVCVDDKLDKLPPDMIVPTMKIKNNKKVWVAEETFEWIQQAKFLRNASQRNFMTGVDAHKVPGYNELEHGSVSDKFTFVAENLGFLSQNYTGALQKETPILTPPKESIKEKLSEKDQKILIDKIDRLRSTQDEKFEEISKLQRADAIVRGSN